MAKRNRNTEPLDLEGEVWKDVNVMDGLYIGRYLVSNLGRIRSVPRLRGGGNGAAPHLTSDRIITQRVTKFGYMTVYISVDGNYKHWFVHRIVAFAFIQNDQHLPFVNHIDGNKTNNLVSNLEWCTASSNVKHAFRMGIMCQKGEKHNNNKLTNKQVVEIYTSKEPTRILKTKYGLSQTQVDNIKNGRAWQHLTETIIK